MSNTLINAVIGMFVLSLPAYAQDLDKEIASLSEKLCKTLVTKGVKKVATVDFVDLQGRPTEIGRFLAEQLSIEMINAEGISIVDRANIKNILAEHKLTEEGLVNPENAKKLGQFAGVDAILIGTVTPLDSDVVLTVKAISTETALAVAGAKASFRKTLEIQQMFRTPSTPSASPASAPSGSASYADSDTIASKDTGDLRIDLKNIRQIKSENGYDRTTMQWVLELSNRSTQIPLLVAANMDSERHRENLRGKVIDASGNLWNLVDCSGISTVKSQPQLVLQRTGSDRIADCISKGVHYNDNIDTSSHPLGWSGSLTPILPTQSIRVSLVFSKVSGNRQKSNAVPDGPLQFEFELVTASGDPSKPTNVFFNTLMLDKVSLPKADTQH